MHFISCPNLASMKTERPVKQAGIMAAILVLATVLAAPTSLYAQSDDKMMGESMMKDKDAMMESAKLLKGSISNVQLDSGGEPEWIQSGFWVLKTRGDSATFVSRITMVRPDGTSLHTHTITHLSVTEQSTEGSTHSIEGLASIMMPSGTIRDVPVTIRVMNNAAIAFWIGPEGVDGHFGTEPIYGTVLQSRAMMEGGAMMDKPVKLTDTNLPVTIPLTRGFADGSEVFYISTEASDEGLAGHLTNITGFRVVYTPALANTPASALASIYAFSNGIEGEGPLGFQPNVADSQPGDPSYSPLWRINVVEWQDGTVPRELRSEEEVLAAQQAGEVEITVTNMVVNCPFVQWEGGSLKIREDKTLTDDTPYGGGQVLDIDIEGRTVTFVAHRGFAPDGSTIYYIATDASVKEVADALGVLFVEKTGATLQTGASSNLWVFTNGIEGTGPMGFQASIAGSNVGDAGYSPLWRITAATWSDAGKAEFLTSTQQISSAVSTGSLTTETAGVIVNCPFVEVN
jgi:hypothetical protein